MENLYSEKLFFIEEIPCKNISNKLKISWFGQNTETQIISKKFKIFLKQVEKMDVKD